MFKFVSIALRVIFFPFVILGTLVAFPWRAYMFGLQAGHNYIEGAIKLLDEWHLDDGREPDLVQCPHVPHVDRQDRAEFIEHPTEMIKGGEVIELPCYPVYKYCPCGYPSRNHVDLVDHVGIAHPEYSEELRGEVLQPPKDPSRN